MIGLLPAPLDAEDPVPPIISRDEARRLHHLLDTLEDAAAFALKTLVKVDLLADRLVAMQTIAEKIADKSGPVEDREVAHAKIELFAQQCDVIAKKATHEGVPVLEGGCYRFPLPPVLPDTPEALEVEVPNLRSRGEGSLGLFEHVDAMVAIVGPGGRVLAGHEVPVVMNEDGELPEKLPPGRYRVELTYLALDASNVRVQLLGEEDDEVIVTAKEVDLSADTEGQEVDLGIGLALTLDRIARADEVEIESSTVQSLEWRHEKGERLDSLEGWFHETVQPRDFELYALFLERPLGVVRAAKERLEAFEGEVARWLEAVAEHVDLGALDEPNLIERLRPNAPAWAAVDGDALLLALAEEV